MSNRVITSRLFGPLGSFPMVKPGIYNQPERQLHVLGQGEIGGKGEGIIYLHKAAKKDGPYQCPRTLLVSNDFFGLKEIEAGRDFSIGELPQEKVAQLIDTLRALNFRAEIALRSSSPAEDQLGHPAAGKFSTEFHGLPLETTASRLAFYKKLMAVLNSSYSSKAQTHWHSLGTTTIPPMAVVIQEVVGSNWQTAPQYFFPLVSGVVNTNSNKFARIASAIGLGMATVGNEPLGLLHRLGFLDARQQVSSEMGKRYGDINFDNIYAIDHQTGDIVLIKGEGSRIFPNDFRKEMHLWPTIAQRASFVALLLEKELGYPVDMEWAQALKGPFSWLQLRLLQKKPPISLPTIPAEAQLLRSEHVKGRGIADFRSVIFIGDFHYDEETLNQYCQKHPDSLILYMTAASRVVNDRVEDKLLPLTKCVIIADTWMDHQASKKLGINHFALNLEEEDKLFIYTPDHKIAKIIKQGKVVENNNDVNFPIKVLSFEQPVRVIVDSENDIGIVFLTGQ